MENVKIDLGAVLGLLTDRLYSTPAVFLRENVQNAIDALRMVRIDGPRPDYKAHIEISATQTLVRIEDWGIGMSEADIRDYFWFIGRSSKLSKEAEDCKVIGRFGIGALANFGVCSRVEVEYTTQGWSCIAKCCR
jgi:molecular chaperone HtpG